VEELLERGSEVAALREAVQDAAGGRGSIVLVAGEAGIGKSSLVRAWAAAPGEDVRVLVGWCEDLNVSRTYGPLHDLASRFGDGLAEALAARDTDAVMDALLRQLDDPLRPTALVLEDLHWADAATLDVVRFVGRRIGPLHAVLVLTYRDDELGLEHPLRRVLGALPGVPLRRVKPRALSRAAVAHLIASRGFDPDDVLRLTGGNPFFVSELVRSAELLPATVLDAVVARLRTLPPATQRAVGVLSVVPRPVPISDVVALVSRLTDVAPAEEHGILTVGAGAVSFRHELTRRAVLGSLPRTTTITYHEAVLERALAQGADRAEVLHHAVEAGRVDLIVAHGPSAAHEAFEAGAHHQAVARQEQVLPHADRLDTGQLAWMLVERAWSLYNLHRFDEAQQAAARAVSLFRDLEHRRDLCRALLTHSRMLYMTNRLDPAFEALEQARQLVPEGDAEVGAEFRVNRLSLLQLTDRHHEVLEEAAAAIRAAEAVGRGDLLAHAINYHGCASAMVGDLGAGTSRVREALRTALETGWWEAAARAHTNLVELLALARDWATFDGAVEEAVAFYEDHDFAAHRFNTLGQRGLSLVLRGELAAADQLLREVERSVRGAGVLEAIPLHARALLAVRAGAPDVDEVVDRAWQLASATRAAQYVVPMAAVGIEWAWSRDEPALADRFVTPALEATGDTRWDPWLRWRLRLVRDVHAGGPADAPRYLAPESLALEGATEVAIAGWRDLRMPYELALELLHRGEEADLLEAVAILDGMGAGPAARIVRRRLRALGRTTIPRGPQPTTRRNPAGLTARQLEVLELIADGLTNAQIADRLVVSIRTVDHHVSAVLQKLGVRSRDEATVAARELGIVPAEDRGAPGPDHALPEAQDGVRGLAAPGPWK
jgi:DNA-binding CsgD family transcriptional regulator/tetratricopeptide (TPR) repeat protein